MGGLGGTQPPRQFIQHAVNVLEGVVGAKHLGQLDAFVDHHPIGHIQTLLELEGADAQQRLLSPRGLTTQAKLVAAECKVVISESVVQTASEK